MPKGKTKPSGKGNNKRGAGLRQGLKNFCPSDEESVNGDACSTVSVCSDRGSFDDGENGNEGVDHEESSGTSNSREILEEKITEAIELMTEKSANTRVGALKTLVNVLSQQFIPDLLLTRRETLRDNIERLLKKGQRNEQGLAADVLQLFVLQLGAIDLDDATVDFNAVKSAVKLLAVDHTVPPEVRSKAINALCLGVFLVESGADEILQTTSLLQPLFLSASKLSVKQKDDLETEGSSGKCSSSKSSRTKSSHEHIASTALSGWSLLLTLLPESYLQVQCSNWMQSLYKLLDDPELDLRLNAGEAIALMVELCNLYEESEEDDAEARQKGIADHAQNDGGAMETFEDHSVYIQTIINKLRSLSVESRKYRTKRDRRQQRHNFRDYVRAVEGGEGPDIDIKFGNGEILEIDSWVKKRRYDAISQVLGPGINRQLSENALVRQIVELGPPELLQARGTTNSKQARNERHYMNSMNFKARCVARGKSRDIRRTDLADD